MEQLTQLEDDLRLNKQQAAPEDRQSAKRAQLFGATGGKDQDTNLPASSFLTSPSQPETVPEMDDEDDSEEFKLDEDLLSGEPEIEETGDLRMQALLNSGEKPRKTEALT